MVHGLSVMKKVEQSRKKWFAESVNGLQKSIAYSLRAFRLVWKAGPPLVVVLAALVIGAGLLPIVSIWLGKFIIDTVVQGLAAGRSDYGNLLRLLGLQAGVTVLLYIVRNVSEALTGIEGERVADQIRSRILKKAGNLDLAFYENPEFYDKLQNALNEIGNRPLSLVQSMFSTVRELFALATIFTILTRLHWLIPLLLVAVTVPRTLVETHYGRSRWSLMTLRAPEARKANYFFSLLTSRWSAKEVQLFGLREYFSNAYRDKWRKFIKQNSSLIIARSKNVTLLGMFASLAAAACYMYVVLRTATGSITLGELTLYSQSVIMCQVSLANIFTRMSSLYENGLFLGNLFSFLDISPEDIMGSLVNLPSEHDPLRFPCPMRKGLEFKGVSFRYPGTDHAAIQDISFSISPGEKVAIVGENGAGKTTLVKLVTRLYDPTEGEILLDGHNLREYDLSDFQEKLSVIFQDFIRYEFTARENIGLGDVQHLTEISRIEMAAEKSGADSVIAKLPKGYETILGRRFAAEVDLSWGQWQRVALSRAFMRDAQIFILDEPTAHLDALAEYQIYDRFAELIGDRNAILISHRFPAIRMADHILVVSDGRLVEEGSHEDLMNRNGEYSHMFRQQIKEYE